MVKKDTQNVNIRTIMASSGLRLLRHWMNGSETTMGETVLKKQE